MQKISATELARNLRAVLDQVSERSEDYLVERSGKPVARISPGLGHMSAEQALADLYRVLPDHAAEGWLEDARRGMTGLDDSLRDPWDS